MSCCSLLRVASFACVFSQAISWRHFMISIPNSGIIPCADVAYNDTNSKSQLEGCLGGYCEVIGHEDCAPSGEINTFGDDFHEGDIVQDAWWTGFCAADSDGDGLTNGDELGDGCCVWQGDDSVFLKTRTPATLSNPASDVSVTTFPSCSRLPPQPITAFTGMGVATNAVSLSWDAVSSDCVCEYFVHITATNNYHAVAHVKGDATSAVFCGLPTHTNVTFTMEAANRAGNSTANGAAPSIVVQTLSVDPLTPVADCASMQLGAGVVVPEFMDTIPADGYARATAISPEAPTAGVALLLAPISMVFIIAVITASTGCCIGLRRHFFGSMPCKCCLGARFLHFSGLRDFVQASNFFIMTIAIAITGILLAWLVSAVWYDSNMLYSPVQVKGAVWRGCGYALAICMGVQILPITRWSPWMYLLGISFDRGVVFHRWVSTLSLILAAIHGLGFAVSYASSDLGLAHIFAWSLEDMPVNPLAGTLAGFGMVVMGVCATSYIRRRKYSLFVAGHSLYPFVLLMAILHVKFSETPSLAVLLPGIVCLCFDHIVVALDVICRPVQLSGINVGQNGAFARLEFSKVARWGWVQHICPFVYEPGQFIYLCIPSVSLLPHPFSISSVPDPTRPGWFSVHVRAMGNGSFTKRLVEKCKAMQESDAKLAVAINPLSAVPPPSPRSLPFTTFNVFATGPFGIPSVPLPSYKHYILFAGGIGITPIAGFRASLVRSLNYSQTHHAAGQGRYVHEPTASITTVWAVREADLLEEFSAALTLVPEESTGHGSTQPMLRTTL